MSTLAKALASVNAQGFKNIMASGGGGSAKQNRTLLDFNFIKKKKMRRMSKTTGNKVSVDKNSSFARFAFSGKTISQWTDHEFNTPIRQKEKSFWFTG